MVNLNPKNSSSLVSGSHTISILGSIFTPLAIVVVVVSGTVVVVEEVEEIVEEAVEEFLDFTTMTKAQIEAWAKENLGIDLDRRKTKAKMIAEVESQLKN